jgi:ADP-heptose:LPS heptosyltransferase
MDCESSAISFYVSGLEEFGVGKTVRNPVISPLGDESFFPFHGEKEGEFLAIHPGAGSANKRFNLSWYLHLASEVKKALQMEVLFMLGPAEVEIGWDCRIKDNGFSVVSIPRLRSATLWLSGSACFIGNDCGLAHISAALGIPTVVFFRNSDPGVWAPAGNKVLVCDTRQGYGLDYFLAMVGKFLGSDDEN